MAKLPIIKAKKLIKVLERLGFVLYHQVGSHAQYKNKEGLKITVPVHAGKDLNRKTLKSIINVLNITVDEFIVFLKNKKR